MTFQTDTTTQGPVGVRGSLWALAFHLVVLVPIGFLASMSQEVPALLSNWDRVPTTVAVIWTMNVIGALGVTIFSVYCGVAIENMRSNAIVLTKAFLFTAVLLSGLSALFLIASIDMIDGSRHARSAVRREAAIEAIPRILFYIYIRLFSHIETSTGYFRQEMTGVFEGMSTTTRLTRRCVVQPPRE